MVKLTKSQFENKLFKLIETNDYENLDQLINQNPEHDINNFSNRKNESFIRYACLMKSRECFEHIISNPKFKLHLSKPKLIKTINSLSEPTLYSHVVEPDQNLEQQNQDEQNQEPIQLQQNIIPIHLVADENSDSDDEIEDNTDLSISDFNYYFHLGVGLAISYFVNAPNLANSFYLKLLISNNVFFNTSELNRLEDYPEFYNQILIKQQNDLDFMKELLFDKIGRNTSFKYFEKLFDQIKSQLNPADINIILEKSISNNRVDIIKLLKSNGYNITKLFDGKYNNQPIPDVDCLSYSLIGSPFDYKKKMPFSDVFKFYVEEYLNNPFEITNKEFFITGFLSDQKLIFTNYETFNKIKFDYDFAPIVMNCLLKILYSKYYFHHIDQTNIELLLSSGICKTNIWNYFQDEDIIKISDQLKSKDYWKSDSIDFLKTILVVSKNNNMVPNEKHSKKLLQLSKLNDELLTPIKINEFYSVNKIQKYIPVETPQPVKKKVIKKKTKPNQDIDV